MEFPPRQIRKRVKIDVRQLGISEVLAPHHHKMPPRRQKPQANTGNFLGLVLGGYA